MAAEFKVKVSSEADSKGIKDAKKEVSALKQETEKLEKQFTGNLTAAVARFTSVVGGVMFALAAGKRAWTEYANAQKQVFALDAALRAHGNLTESVRVQFQQLAAEMQKLTAIADDEWIEVIKRLTQFGVDPGQMEATVAVVKNLAGVLDGDVRQAAEVAVRALGGNFEA